MMCIRVNLTGVILHAHVWALPLAPNVVSLCFLVSVVSLSLWLTHNLPSLLALALWCLVPPLLYLTTKVTFSQQSCFSQF